MQAKTKQIHNAFEKLKMETRNTHHKIATFKHNGVSILKTRLSFGSGDAMAVNQIRQQLKLNEEQFQLLIDCPLKREEYIEILKSKKLIV